MLKLNVTPSGVEEEAAGQTPVSGGSGPTFSVDSSQWIRKLIIKVGDEVLDVSNMQAQFQVRQADVPQPGYAITRITNLSGKTTQSIMKLREFTKLEIEAGYVGRYGPIFKGQIFQMKCGREPNGTDTYLDLIATTNHQAYGFSTVNKTLAKGHTFRDIVNEAVKPFKQFGVEIGHIADLGDKKMPRASVLFGMSRSILRDVAFATNTSWSIQNEMFQMVRNDGYLPGQAKVLNSDTGMIGQPEQTLNGIIVRCLIDSGLKPGSRVHIDEKSIQRATLDPSFGGRDKALQEADLPGIATDGIYRVYRVDQDGVIEDTPWYTTLTCAAVGDKSLAAGRLSSSETGVVDTGGGYRGVAEEDDKWGGK